MTPDTYVAFLFLAFFASIAYIFIGLSFRLTFPPSLAWIPVSIGVSITLLIVGIIQYRMTDDWGIVEVPLIVFIFTGVPHIVAISIKKGWVDANEAERWREEQRENDRKETLAKLGQGSPGQSDLSS